MAKLPVFFTASTKAIAEKAIQRGILKYPGLCYIEDGNVIAWMTEDNEIRYTKGDKQITGLSFLYRLAVAPVRCGIPATEPATAPCYRLERF